MINLGQTKKLHADRLNVPLLALDFYVKQKHWKHTRKQKTNKEKENEQREIQN